MNYSAKQAVINAAKIKLNVCIAKIKTKNPDFLAKHPDWARDYSKTGDTTQIVKKIKTDLDKRQVEIQRRLLLTVKKRIV